MWKKEILEKILEIWKRDIKLKCSFGQQKDFLYDGNYNQENRKGEVLHGE